MKKKWDNDFFPKFEDPMSTICNIFWGKKSIIKNIYRKEFFIQMIMLLNKYFFPIVPDFGNSLISINWGVV